MKTIPRLLLLAHSSSLKRTSRRNLRRRLQRRTSGGYHLQAVLTKRDRGFSSWHSHPDHHRSIPMRTPMEKTLPRAWCTSPNGRVPKPGDLANSPTGRHHSLLAPAVAGVPRVAAGRNSKQSLNKPPTTIPPSTHRSRRPSSTRNSHHHTKRDASLSSAGPAGGHPREPSHQVNRQSRQHDRHNSSKQGIASAANSPKPWLYSARRRGAARPVPIAGWSTHSSKASRHRHKHSPNSGVESHPRPVAVAVARRAAAATRPRVRRKISKRIPWEPRE